MDQFELYNVSSVKIIGEGEKTKRSTRNLLCASSNPFYGTCTMLRLLDNMYPSRIVYHQNETLVYWNDGEVTRVACGKGETYSEYTAFCAALAKRIFGSTSAVKKICRDYNDECLREQESEVKRIAEEEKERIRLKREKKHVKRMAKALVLQRKAEELANKMMKG